ncbi:hypothetical protein BDB00DRAFT_772235 [Zychaea mexicana]|uniref:uncharacterized protein n=1 Tax=Zychaea mexicana TaxID=64656 RepID=UPI0022FE192E|nr:uncharacterized protein BDB00DRAFT_772235 [Zychaea mexicana]KAI9488611.1 hypothetical protein BDB00DRAFT_772235 [Zychaea mexicana]
MIANNNNNNNNPHPIPAVPAVVKKAQQDGRDVEQAIVAQDIQGRSIHNDTVGPAGWTDETPEDFANFVKSLRPVDRTLLDKALPAFHVVTDDYVHVPIVDAFNWDETAQRLGKEAEGEWFIVAFRSVRKADADKKLLFEADARAQEEAVHSGGLLKYWYGDLNEHSECLAMCIWVNREYALKATRKPLHMKAAKLASEMYISYQLERYSLVKRAGETVFQIQAL